MICQSAAFRFHASSSSSYISSDVSYTCTPDGISAILISLSCLFSEYPKKALTRATITSKQLLITVLSCNVFHDYRAPYLLMFSSSSFCLSSRKGYWDMLWTATATVTTDCCVSGRKGANVYGGTTPWWNELIRLANFGTIPDHCYCSSFEGQAALAQHDCRPRWVCNAERHSGYDAR
jgi:hypothetical protein